jgi:hypothetical protein
MVGATEQYASLKPKVKKKQSPNPESLLLDFRVSRSFEMKRSLYLTTFNFVELESDLRVITLSD